MYIVTSTTWWKKLSSNVGWGHVWTIVTLPISIMLLSTLLLHWYVRGCLDPCHIGGELMRAHDYYTWQCLSLWRIIRIWWKIDKLQSWRFVSRPPNFVSVLLFFLLSALIIGSADFCGNLTGVEYIAAQEVLFTLSEGVESLVPSFGSVRFISDCTINPVKAYLAYCL